MNQKLTAILVVPTLLGLTAVFLLRGAGSEPAGLPPAATPAVTGSAPKQVGIPVLRTLAEARPGLYWAPAGSRIRYSLDTATEVGTTVRDPEQGERSESQVLRMRGRLLVEIVARREREAVVAFTCSELSTDLPAAAAAGAEPAQLAGLRARNLARIDVDGRILGYRFAAGLDQPERDFVRGLVGGFGFVVPPDAGATWEAEGCDSTGQFTGRYERLGADEKLVEVQRTRLRYLEQRDAESMPVTPGGTARAAIDAAELGWLIRAEVDELTTIAATLAPVEFRVSYRASLKLLDSERQPIETTESAAAFDGHWEPAGGHGEDATAALDARDRDDWNVRLRGQSVGSIAAAMADLLAAGQSDSQELHELWSAARWLLRIQPEAIAEVAALLATTDLEPQLASLWLSALADAGSEPAQAAVLATWSDPRRAVEVRGAAAAAMFDVRAPSSELVGAVATWIDGLREIDAVDATAILALGALAQRQAAMPGDDRAGLAALESWRSNARRLDAEDLWLDALANARSPLRETAALEALDDDRLHIRAAGVRALGTVEGARAFAALCRLAGQDHDPAIRAEALTQLATRAEPAARGALMDGAESDPDARVREAALLALARLGIAADDRARLQTIARSDADATVRSLAQRLLQS